MGNRLSVTLISSLAGEEEVVPAPAKRAKVAPMPEPATPEPEPESIAPMEPPVWEQREEILPEVVAEGTAMVSESMALTPELIQNEEMEPPAPIEAEIPSASLPEEPEIEEPPPQPRVILPRKKPTVFKEPKPAVEKKPLAKQEVMQFEPVTRGRFEKSEPTIVEGQDLDVPTFLRKNVRVK
jgi:hypothetical protein